MLKSTESAYGLVTRALHWLVAALVIGLIWLGWWMVGLTYYDRWYNTSLETHKALGLTVLALAVVKIAWVALDGKPRLPPSIGAWERRGASVAHYLFYVLMIAVPVTGYFISTSAGDGIPIFGWFEVPAITALGEGPRELAIELHYWLAYAMAGLVAVHVLAALKHQFIDRDGTLSRMLW